MAYWIVVGSEQNMRIAEARGFDVFGFKSTRRTEAARIKPGDKLIFYLTKTMKFGGIAEVTSECFEDHERVFVSTKPALSGVEGKPREDYPYRVRVKPLIVLTPKRPTLRRGSTLAEHLRQGRNEPVRNNDNALLGIIL